MNFIDWFFLCEGRTADGLFSLPHLFAVTYTLFNCVIIMLFLGLKYKNNQKAINIILKVCAFIMIALYVFEVTDSLLGRLTPLEAGETRISLLEHIIGAAPLYLCDIAIFAIPIIAFTKGRVRTVVSDFMAIWGIPMGVIGTYLAGNIFPKVPVFSFDGWLAIYIHVIPASVAIFLYVTKLASLERKNMFINIRMFIGFMIFVLGYNYLFNFIFNSESFNFMFFTRGDGTPFDLFRPYVPLWVYQIIVFALYSLYMIIFYVVYYAIMKKINNHKTRKTALAY